MQKKVKAAIAPVEREFHAHAEEDLLLVIISLVEFVAVLWREIELL